MNERQSRFVDYYIQTANASKAARMAGYSAKTAYSIGQENLNKPEISEAIEKRLAELKTARTVELQEVLEHLSAVLRGEVTETLLTPSGKSFVVPVKECDRLAAAEKLLKIYGAYREKVEVTSANLFVQTLREIAAEEE